MPLKYEGNIVHFEDHCIVDEALELAQFFAANKASTVDMSRCASAHTALVQLLPFAGLEQLIAPSNASLCKVLIPFLNESCVNVIQYSGNCATDLVP